MILISIGRVFTETELDEIITASFGDYYFKVAF
jgi:hypothetical protein